jgi:hypothetical protein
MMEMASASTSGRLVSSPSRGRAWFRPRGLLAAFVTKDLEKSGWRFLEGEPTIFER